MYAFRVRCDHLAGRSLEEEGQRVEFDLEGISGPLSEALADYLTNIPGFVVHDTVEIDDPVEQETAAGEVAEPEAASPLLVQGPVEDGALPPTEESAFLRWFNVYDAEQRAQFVAEENLRRDELLRVLKEETREGKGHPKVLAAVAAALFRLRRGLFGQRV